MKQKDVWFLVLRSLLLSILQIFYSLTLSISFREKTKRSLILWVFLLQLILSNLRLKLKVSRNWWQKKSLRWKMLLERSSMFRFAHLNLKIQTINMKNLQLFSISARMMLSNGLLKLSLVISLMLKLIRSTKRSLLRVILWIKSGKL